MEKWKKLLHQAAEHAEAARKLDMKNDGKERWPAGDREAYDTHSASALRLKAEADQAKKDHESQELLKSLAEHDGDAPEGAEDPDHWSRKRGSTKDGGTTSAWAREVTSRLQKSAGTHGVKALLQGEIRTPSVVELVDLPHTPRRLIDLIGRDPMAEHTHAYLRQVARENNAAIVPDGTTKPTTTFSFEEVKGEAKVIAHLSEPFPLRYLSDYSSVMQLVGTEMQEGVLDKVEQQILSGTGPNDDPEDSELMGVLTTTGITAVPFATDKLTTIRKARTVLENKGERPNAWVFNPTDLEAFDLMRENGANGAFLLNSSVADTIFGPFPRIASPGMPAGTAVLADWSMLRLMIREDDHTLVSTQSGDLFDKNQAKMRAEGQYDLKNRRPQAFAKVSLTA